MNTLIVRKYTLNHKASLLQLLVYKWENLTTEKIKEKFEWRYEKNPLTKNEPCIYVTLDNDKVVGFRAFVIQKFIFNHKTYRVYTPADAIVHPNYRRMGIFSKLNNIFLEDIKNQENTLILNTSSNQFSSPGSIKQGWNEMNYINKFGYRFRMFRKIVNACSLQNYKLLKEQQEVIVNKEKYQFVFTQELKIDSIVQLNEKHRNPMHITHLRDASFYRWKYLYLHSNEYYYAYCYHNAQLIGYVIFYKYKPNKLIIEEYIVLENKLFNRLVGRCMTYFNISNVRIPIFSYLEEKNIIKSGFFIEPTFVTKVLGKVRLPFLTRPTTKEPSQKDFMIEPKVDIRDVSNWFFQHSVIH